MSISKAFAVHKRNYVHDDVWSSMYIANIYLEQLYIPMPSNVLCPQTSFDQSMWGAVRIDEGVIL